MPNLSGLRRFADLAATRLVATAGYRLRRHIGLAMQERALTETADYVVARMATAAPIDDPTRFLRHAASWCRAEPGLVLECGVWKGASIRVLAKLFQQVVYGFDAFEGLPENWRGNLPAGAFALSKPPRVPRNVTLVKGWFTDTLPVFFRAHPESIKLLHVDCDLYSSTRDVLAACAGRLVSGTVIVFDEYFNYPGWQAGEFKAWQEFVAKHRIGYRYVSYTIRHEQVAVIIE